MTATCDCCGGPFAATPRDISNPPGQPTLRRRVGAYGDFLSAMTAELSSAARPGLAGLRTRDAADPALAFVDAWAVAADVLTFYQERYGAEGYLRTAAERRSVFELARLVDYRPRPGVAAGVLLAYSLDDGAAPVDIAAGSKAQNVPLPGETMQTFETSEELAARVEWNRLIPRLGRPPLITVRDALSRTRLRFRGAALDLRPGDRLLFMFADAARPRRGAQVLRRIAAVDSRFDEGFSDVRLHGRPGVTREAIEAIYGAHERLARMVAPDDGPTKPARRLLDRIADFALGGPAETFRDLRFTLEVGEILKSIQAALDQQPEALVRPHPETDPLSLAAALAMRTAPIPPSPAALTRALPALVASRSDTIPQILTRMRPALKDTYYRAWANLPARRPPPGPAPQDLVEGLYEDAAFEAVHVLRASAHVYGFSAPRSVFNADGRASPAPTERAALDTDDTLSLETADEAVEPGSLLLIERGDFGQRSLRVARAASVTTLARNDYQLQARTTRITLVDPVRGERLAWLGGDADNLDVLRTTMAHVRSEALELADDPIEELAGAEIELPQLVDGLRSGRRIVVVGERADIRDADGQPIRGVEGREAAMIAAVTHGAPGPGDRAHTTLTLAAPLTYRYRRDTVRIYGNVVKATHGETRREPLGSGDAAKPLLSFALKHAPLTFVPSPTPAGAQSTLEVRVNDLRWRETASLAGEAAAARVYVLDVAEDGVGRVTFGTGREGARPPSGTANIQAIYRAGLGRPGNVGADSITVLTSRSLGVKAVINPLAAAGGADADSRDQIRRNVPLAVSALDRLVSVQDYADFARSFAGVGHAAAVRLSDGRGQVVHVTVAGVDDIPLAGSDLLADLAAAMRRFGDPTLPLVVAPRELAALVTSARIAIDPDYRWEDVAARLRTGLLQAFAFDARPLGRSAYLSQVLAALQAQAGVLSVDVDIFDAIAEHDLADAAALKAKLAQLQADQPRAIVRAEPARPGPSGPEGPQPILPAQLAVFVPQVPDTIVLNRR